MLVVKSMAEVNKAHHEKANLSALLASMLEPFMPITSEEIFRQLNTNKILVPDSFGQTLQANHKECYSVFLLSTEFFTIKYGK